MNNGYGVRYYCAGCVDVYWHTFFFIHNTHNYYIFTVHILLRYGSKMLISTRVSGGDDSGLVMKNKNCKSSKLPHIS